MSAFVIHKGGHSAAGHLGLGPLNAVSLCDQAYAKLKDAIANTDIYNQRQPLRLDERALMQALGVSRTPIREALSILEQEGARMPNGRREASIRRRLKEGLPIEAELHARLKGFCAPTGK